MTSIIAHRGASYDAPENTLESIQLGLNQGADAVECDVRLSRDGELMVIHDPTLQRLAGIKQSVADLSTAELQTLDVGSWKAATWQGTRIPTLIETLELIPADRRIFIEVKVGLASLPRLKEVLDATSLSPSQLIVMEFDLETVIAMRSTFPEIEVLWLNDFPLLQTPAKKRRTLIDNLDIAQREGFDGVDLQNIPQLNAETLAECRARDLRCYCWTVDKPNRAAELIQGGIHGVTTNRPGWMRKQLNGTAS